jgi:hypothetical protein
MARSQNLQTENNNNELYITRRNLVILKRVHKTNLKKTKCSYAISVFVPVKNKTLQVEQQRQQVKRTFRLQLLIVQSLKICQVAYNGYPEAECGISFRPCFVLEFLWD